MDKNNLANSTRLYLAGIGGSGMSALAAILHKKGKEVSGSDMSESPATANLAKMGIKISIGTENIGIPEDTELLIYSPAIKNDHQLRIAAESAGIRQMSYPEAVGELTEESNTIAVCGTHGKTTVTAMISAILINAGKDPSVIVGSHTRELENRNYRLGKGDYLVIEACEYCRNFLNYHPDIIVMNNVEVDHLDYYKDENDYKMAFIEFIGRLPAGGLLVYNASDENIRSIIREISGKDPNIDVISFGNTTDAVFSNDGNKIYRKKTHIGDLNIKIPGQHNIMNALAAFTAASSIGIESQVAIEALNNYGGANRRFEYLGSVGRTEIYDDYAHHPTEIKATLAAARARFGQDKKILCIFQPHQYSRTHKLIDGFATAFSDADYVIISDIYKTRDTGEDEQKISTSSFVDILNKNHQQVVSGGSLDKTAVTAKSHLSEFDAVIIMGAGDIYKIGPELLTNRAP